MKSIQKAVSKLNNNFEKSHGNGNQEGESSNNVARLSELVDIDFDLEQEEISEWPGLVGGSTPVDLRGERGVQHGNVEDQQVASTISDQSVGIVKHVRRIGLPISRFKKMGIITPDAPKSQIAEEFRNIKRPLIANIAALAAGGNTLANVIMVTSCVEGEGKTYTAINLAMSLAMERDRTVLLIDSDVAKASASMTLGLNSEGPGLTDILMNPSIGINDIICHTDIDNLRCVPVGSKSDHSTELLASDGMRALIKQVSYRYADRIIIFDAPPILVTSEAMVLAAQVGQIVFVVGAESTTHNMVADALGRIRGKACIGLVLNKISKKLATNYGYGYGYDQNQSRRLIEGG